MDKQDDKAKRIVELGAMLKRVNETIKSKDQPVKLKQHALRLVKS